MLVTSLCFGEPHDFNAKSEENRKTIMNWYVNSNVGYVILQKYKNNLWLKDEIFLRKLLNEENVYHLLELLGNIKNKNILNDKKLFLKLAKIFSSTFKFASDILKSDKEYVLKLLQSGCDIYEYINPKLYGDKQITLVAVKQPRYNSNLKYANKKLKNNKQIVLESVQNNGRALKYASNALKDDRQIVLEAAKCDPRALVYASKRIKNDKKIMWEAIRQDGRAFEYASNQIKSDKKFVLEALKSYPYSLLYADKNMMKNKDIVLYFFKSLKKNEYLATSYHNILMKIHPSLLDDEKIMLEAVKKNGMYLQYASKMLKGNQRIAMQAVSTNGMALKYVDKELLENKEIIAMALKNNPKIMYYIDYVKNRIKRKFKPLAWESYDINETLNLLYGKNRIYEKSKEIHIKLPTNTLEYFDYKYIKIATTKKVKSISILQKKEGDRALIALYQPYGRTSNIRLPLKILNAMLTMGIEGMKIIVVTETEDKHLFLNEYRIKYRNFCTSFDYGKDDYLDELKEDLTKKMVASEYFCNFIFSSLQLYQIIPINIFSGQPFCICFNS
jgi:hypothetical protein